MANAILFYGGLLMVCAALLFFVCVGLNASANGVAGGIAVAFSSDGRGQLREFLQQQLPEATIIRGTDNG